MMTHRQTVLRVEPLVIQKNNHQAVTPYTDLRELPQMSQLPINSHIISQTNMNNLVKMGSIFNQNSNNGQVGPYQT